MLIGPPGAGKSSIGKNLAKRMNRTFIDTDEMVEKRSGKKISEIFLEDGEAGFRALEKESVLEALRQANSIISLGGGAVLARLGRRRGAGAGAQPAVGCRRSGPERPAPGPS